MNNISNHTTALVHGRATAAHARQRAVADNKAQTAKTLRRFNTERKVMAKTLKSELVADRTSRSAEVLEILENTNEMTNEFRQEHELMSESLRQSLAESIEAVVSTVASLFVDFSKDRVAFFKAHRRMAKAQGAGLAKDRLARSNAVDSLCLDFAKALRRMAKAQGDGLAKDRHHRSLAVAELIRSFAKAHHHMAKVQSASLAKGRRERSAAVSELIQSFHGARGPTVHPVAKSMPATMPVIKAPLPSSNWIAPEPLAPRLVLKPAAPIAARKHEPVKPLPKVAQSSAKPWPSAPPRGEPVKHVAKKVKAKATPAKTVRAIAKAIKPKKK